MMGQGGRRPEISVVVTSVEGRAAFLQEALESLAGQTRLPDEVVLVLEGSDPAWNALESWKRRLPLRVIRRPRVSGRAGPPKTQGLQEARGTFVALLDDDDVALPHRLEVEHAFLKDHPEYGWVGARMEMWRQGERVGIWPRVPPGPLDLEVLFEENRVAYSTVMLTRQAVEVLGGFREDLPLAPDYEAWLRLVSRGIRGFLLDEVLVRYRIHEKNVSLQEMRRAEALVAIRERYRPHVSPHVARRVMRRTYRDLARALERERRPGEAATVWWKAWREEKRVKDFLRFLRCRMGAHL